MAQRKINADVKVTGKLLGNFSGSHYLAGTTDVRQALLILDDLIHNLTARQAEVLTAQIDGLKDTFQTAEPFSAIRVVLNGLEQSEGANADYKVLDNAHIQFFRPLNTNEILRVDYVIT